MIEDVAWEGVHLVMLAANIWESFLKIRALRICRDPDCRDSPHSVSLSLHSTVCHASCRPSVPGVSAGGCFSGITGATRTWTPCWRLSGARGSGGRHSGAPTRLGATRRRRRPTSRRRPTCPSSPPAPRQTAAASCPPTRRRWPARHNR